LKITHIVSALTKGGAERIVVELANKAVENGDEVTIISSYPVDPELLIKTIKPNIKLLFVLSKPVSTKMLYFSIIPWVFKNKFWLNTQNVLHCHLTFGAVFGCVAKLILRKKISPIIVETNHAVGMDLPKFNRWLQSKMILLKDGLILMAQDKYWDSFLVKHPNLKKVIIPNGIALSTALKSDDGLLIFKDKVGISQSCNQIVGTVGMLRPDRRPYLYLPIFKKIHSAVGTNVEYVIGGDGIEFDNLKSALNDLGLNAAVKMPGLIQEPAATICNFDVYVSLSVGKTTGVSMIEAAMCKVPVVGIQLIDEYVATNEDWVWSHTDTEKVADYIISLLKNEEERKRVAQKQYDYVLNNLTSDIMYESYNKFYKKTLLKK
jgi:glycosyltransferase involved in cell wall biosynthesis